MAIQYINHSTANNPHVASFSLGMHILGTKIQSVSLTRDQHELQKLAEGGEPNDKLFQLFPLASYLFLNVKTAETGLISTVDLVAGTGEAGDTLTVGLSERFSKAWSQQTLSAVARHIGAFASQQKHMIYPDHILKHCETTTALEIKDAWDQFFLEIWEAEALPYLKSHGGHMDLDKVTFDKQADGSYKANIFVSTAGACNGCGNSQNTTKHVHSLLQQYLTSYNARHQGTDHHTPIHMGFIDVTTRETKSRILLKTPKMTNG